MPGSARASADLDDDGAAARQRLAAPVDGGEARAAGWLHEDAVLVREARAGLHRSPVRRDPGADAVGPQLLAVLEDGPRDPGGAQALGDRGDRGQRHQLALADGGGHRGGPLRLAGHDRHLAPARRLLEAPQDAAQQAPAAHLGARGSPVAGRGKTRESWAGAVNELLAGFRI